MKGMSINRVLILGVLLLLQVLLIARCQEVAMSEATEQADLETASVEVDAATGGSEYEQAEAAATELPRKTSPPTIYEELLGDSLYVWGSETNPDGTKKEETVYEMYTSELMKDVDVVALYFSASWCGPCKQFTPQLAEFYKSMKKKGEKFEIVWISADRTGEEFLAYYQKMPWLAVTMDNVQKVTEKLSPKYQVRGIPHLVILDGHDASVYTLDGRTMVMKDQYGLEFPWRPRSIMNLLPRNVRSAIKNKIAQFKTDVRDRLIHILKGIVPPSLWSLLFPKQFA